MLKRKNEESPLIFSDSNPAINEENHPVKVVNSVDGYDGFGDSTTDTIRRKTLSRSSKLIFDDKLNIPPNDHLPEAEEDLDNNYLFNLDSEKIIQSEKKLEPTDQIDGIDKPVEDDNNNVEKTKENKKDESFFDEVCEISIEEDKQSDQSSVDEKFELDNQVSLEEFKEKDEDSTEETKDKIDLMRLTSDYGSNETDSLGNDSKFEEPQTPTIDSQSDRDDRVSVDHCNPIFNSEDHSEDERQLREEEDINLTIGRIKVPNKSEKDIVTVGIGSVQQMRALFENLAGKGKN